MRKPGKRCKERDASDYLSNSDVQERYFFKVMTGDFHEQLGIPDKFVQHFGGRIAKIVKLESRTGRTFDVEVTRSLSKMVLKTGWKGFVCAHDLKMGDFLVFRYNGTSRVKVWIFDLSCCEKMPPYRVTRSPTRGRGREEHNDYSGSCDDLPMQSTGSKRKGCKQREGSMNVNTSPSTSPSGSSGYELEKDLLLQDHDFTFLFYFFYVGDSVPPEILNSHSIPNCILPQRTHLTYVQKEKLKEKVRAICSKTPIYGCVMKKTSIEGRPQTMDISREYADAYLPFEDQTLMLQRRGKSWEVRCRIQRGNGNFGTKRLLKGWGRFGRDNNLQLGDLCLFELLENSKFTMNVHIIHNNEI